MLWLVKALHFWPATARLFVSVQSRSVWRVERWTFHPCGSLEVKKKRKCMKCCHRWRQSKNNHSAANKAQGEQQDITSVGLMSSTCRWAGVNETCLLPAGSEPNSNVADPVKDLAHKQHLYLLCIWKSLYFSIFQTCTKKMLICFFEEWKEKKHMNLVSVYYTQS